MQPILEKNMKHIPMMNLKAQNSEVIDEISYAITKVIKTGVFINGEACKSFQKKFSELIGIRECIPVGNGTDALEIALEALEMPQGAEVLVPVNTFVGSVEAIIRTGFKPVFCEFNSADLNLCPKDAERMITSKTKAIMAVHLYGRPADVKALKNICDKYGLYLIEDCAQAHLANVKSQYVGSFGDIAAFSFYPGKNLGAFGDAGAVVTNNEFMALRARLIANHGRIEKYDHKVIGRNSRMDEFQASVLNIKIDHLKDWTSRRRKNADIYYQMLSNCEKLILPDYHPGNAYHLFPVISSIDRDVFRAYLRDQNIETGLHYPKLITEFNAYLPWVSRSFESLAELNSRIFTIPMNETLSSNDLAHVCKHIRKFCNEISFTT